MLQNKVLITGCGGMLGDAVYPYFKSKYENVLASDKDVNGEGFMRLDVRDDVHLGSVFRGFRPDIVLHLAAETDLEYCEVNHDIAKDTNELATKTIAKLSEEYGATLIYISTAGVFDGLKIGSYTEQDQPNPIMVYGQTKYDGEIHALKHCSRTFVVRAGWMMGGGRRREKKFIYKMLQQIAEGKKELFAVTDKWGAPTYTYDFAVNLSVLLGTRQYGIYHMVCEGKGTRYDVAKEILSICNRPDIKLTAVDSEFFKKEYFVPRPPSEVMVNEQLRKNGINRMRPWQISLQDYIENHFEDFIAKPELKHIRAKGRSTKIQEIKSSTEHGKMGWLKKKEA